MEACVKDKWKYSEYLPVLKVNYKKKKKMCPYSNPATLAPHTDHVSAKMFTTKMRIFNFIFWVPVVSDGISESLEWIVQFLTGDSAVITV